MPILCLLNPGFQRRLSKNSENLPDYLIWVFRKSTLEVEVDLKKSIFLLGVILRQLHLNNKILNFF